MCCAEGQKKSNAVLRLTIHLVRLQAGHQVPVHLNKWRLGLFVLIQDQLGGDGKRALRDLSPVLHLLFSICQALASLLLLSESLLGLRTQVLIVHYPADLSATSGRAFKARLVICILFITLFDYKKGYYDQRTVTYQREQQVPARWSQTTGCKALVASAQNYLGPPSLHRTIWRESDHRCQRSLQSEYLMYEVIYL